MALTAKLRAICRLFIYFLITIVFLPFIGALHYLRFYDVKRKLVTVYYRCCAYSWGISLKMVNQFSHIRPLLVVSNHCSYADIAVLGSVAPVHFTPKSEIRDWPFIGFLCVLAECIFIDRNPRQTAQNMQQLKAAVAQNWMISLFPEGTTNDGVNMHDFRSSYFSLAEQGIAVQPVTLCYTQPNGQPLSDDAMRKVAWIGDDDFAPHLFEFLGQPRILVTVICHDVIENTAFINRKELAKLAQQIVADGLL